MDDLDKDEVIQEYYENPETSGSAKTLYANIKEDGYKGITLKYIKSWLDEQEEKQITKKYQQSGYYIPRYPKQEYQLDLFYFIEPDSNSKQSKKFDSVSKQTFKLNDGYKFGLVCIDIFTKYAKVEPLKDRTSKATTEATLRIFDKMGKPEVVYTDDGKEFLGEFERKMLELNVIHLVTANHAPFAEVFIKTFKNKLYPLMRRANTKVYYNKKNDVNRVDSTVNSYNNTQHSVIGLKPNQAIKPKNEKKVRENIYKTYLKKTNKLVKRPELKVGDYVRTFIKKELFSKDYEPSYSKAIYKIVDIPNFKGKPVEASNYYIKLDNGTEFLPNELLKVKPPKNYKPSKIVEKYSAGTEKQLRELAKAKEFDDGTADKLKERDFNDLIEKKEERSKRERRKPKKFE